MRRAQQVLTPDEYQLLVWQAMSEKELDEFARSYALSHRWLTYHTWLAVHSEDGFPDRFFVREGRIIAAEFKREGRWPTDAQYLWLAELQLAGIEVHVWHPHDQADIEEVLR